MPQRHIFPNYHGIAPCVMENMRMVAKNLGLSARRLTNIDITLAQKNVIFTEALVSFLCTYTEVRLSLGRACMEADRFFDNLVHFHTAFITYTAYDIYK